LRSKNKKKGKNRGRKGRSRTERIVAFLRGGTIVLFFVAAAAAMTIGAKYLYRAVTVEQIMVTGNYHLDVSEIVEFSGVSKGDPLFGVSLEEIDRNLRRHAWIKDVSVKKILPDTIDIRIREATPRALLSSNKHLYLLDGDGEVLERIRGDTVPFLPVIKNISPRDRKSMKEAVRLVSVLNDKKLFTNRETVEISLQPYGLSMNVDGELIKVGYGNYDEKFERWKSLEPEIRKRGVLIKYVDLRFKDSIVVKPLRRKKKGRSF
jgi:cell division septal protein FtsQ